MKKEEVIGNKLATVLTILFFLLLTGIAHAMPRGFAIPVVLLGFVLFVAAAIADATVKADSVAYYNIRPWLFFGTSLLVIEGFLILIFGH